MIYLWFPAFESGTQDIDVSQVEDPWDDSNWSLDTARTKLKLRNPDFYDSIEKPTRIELKRAMSGSLRTYVIRDRVNMDTHYVTLQFQALRNERKLALEHFLMCAKGQYIGYKDPDDLLHAVKLETQDIVITTETSARGIGPYGVDCIDDYSAVSIRLMIVRTYYAVDWD